MKKLEKSYDSIPDDSNSEKIVPSPLPSSLSTKEDFIEGKKDPGVGRFGESVTYSAA